MRLCSSTAGSSTISPCPKKQRTTKGGGEVCLSFCHGAKSPPGLSPSQWDWGSFEPRRLRRARVKPPARFTGVSPRMWGVCTAEPRCCQRAPRRPLRAPARERMAFLEGLNFFALPPSGSYCGQERECFSIAGAVCWLFLILAQRALNYLTLWSVKYCKAQSRC